MMWSRIVLRARIGMQNAIRGDNRARRRIRNFPSLPILRVAAALQAITLTGCTTGEPASVVVLATTHTIEDTGLLDVLVDAFARDHADLRLQVVVAGSGEVLEYGRRGDADVLLTHAPEDEERFVAEGHGAGRTPIMRNEFIVYGPGADPAGVRGLNDAAEAFRRIRAAAAPFISRGDDSGTHKRELAIWSAAGEAPAGEWYDEAGVGQADALRVASERQAYILADRGTFAVLASVLELVPLVEGDPRLVNTYSVMRVTRAPHPAEAAVLERWLTSDTVRALIPELGSDAAGRPLFEPLADSAAVDAADRPLEPRADSAAADRARLEASRSRLTPAPHG